MTNEENTAFSASAEAADATMATEPVEDTSPELQERLPHGSRAVQTEESQERPVREESLAAEIMALQAQLDEANRKASELQEAYLRAQADYQNLKRRSQEERDNLRQYVAEDLIKRLLPAVDNFERGLAAAEQTKDYDKLIGGVQAVYRQLQDFLTKEGVTVIEAVNQPFDPNIHNAVLSEETSDQPENTVIEELQKGYRLHGRVLRPTMVKVST